MLCATRLSTAQTIRSDTECATGLYNDRRGESEKVVLDRHANFGKSRDLLAISWSWLLLFCLPAITIAVTGVSAFGNRFRTIVWTTALGVLGTACSINAARCGRIHCYLTGPFFFAMAAVALLYGTGVLALGEHGWNLIGLTILIGAIVFCCLPEIVFGKYRRSRSDDSSHR
jgi:hypothetical protein